MRAPKGATRRICDACCLGELIVCMPSQDEKRQKEISVSKRENFFVFLDCMKFSPRDGKLFIYLLPTHSI